MRPAALPPLVGRVTFSRADQARAWCVHALTASGAAIGAYAVVAMHRGDLREAAVAMMLTFAIDSVDGSLARRYRVADVLPWFDGRRLDDMVDYLNYVVVAALFLLAVGALPSPWWLVPPIVASAYGFSNEDAKTEDDFFLGFPSYWNIVGIYAWLLDLEATTGAVLVSVLSVLVFVPIKYLYPSKMKAFRRTMILGGAVWFALLAGCIVWHDALASYRVAEISLVYPALYFVLSFKLGGWHRPQHRPHRSGAGG
jgi:phosphatidylcholine synthase